MKTTKKACTPKALWGYLGVQGAFVEPSRREFKSPLLVLCLLSDDSESRGPPGLRAD